MLGKAVFRDFCRIFWCALFASVLGVFCGIYAASAYTVTYNCGFYDSGTTPPAQDTATDNTSFTPAANTCLPTNGATFAGWVVSGTGDVKQSGESFVWNYDEDKTFTAIWNCYWNSDETECVPGYTITLMKDGCPGIWNPPIPDKLYTIKGRGVYIGPERTEEQLMEYRRIGDTNHPGRNPIQNPFIRFEYDLDVSIYVPTNPVTGQSYVVEQPDPVTDVYTFNFSGYNDLDAAGYIAQGGKLANVNGNTTVVSHFGSGCGNNMPNEPGIVGYAISWYDANGTKVTQKPCSSDCSKPRTGTLYAKWKPITYNIVYELGNVGDWGAGAKHPASVDYDTAFEVSNPISNNGYTFAGWAITGMDGVTHYYSESPIFVNNVYQSSTTQTSSGISLSGTKATHFMNLRSKSGTVTFTAQWVCVDGYYWNSNTSECVQGHTITLQQPESCTYEYNPSVPTVLYTIQNNGIYRDAERNQLMIQQNQNGGQYQIEMPTATCVVKRNFGNLPRNPVTNDLYEPTSSVTYDNLGTVSMSDITRTISATSFNFQNQEIMSNFCTHDCTYNAIDSDGYITAYGSALSAIDADMTWTLSMEPVSVTLNERPEVTGYDVAWYDNQSGEGASITGTFCGWCNTPTEVYAIWTPQTRNVLYYKGAHASSTSIDIYQQTNGVTYDAPYTALAFDEAPISENMAAAQGYVFVGWTTDSTPTFDNNGNLNHEFTHVDHYQQSGGLFGGLQLYAAYKCDTENGYHLDTNGACVFNTVNLNWIVNGEPYVQNQSSCIYGNETINGISHEEIPGWTFTGWTVTNWE